MATKKEETPMLDPIAYRSDYNPNNIMEEYKGDPNIPGVGPQNANLNYQEYGDDSNPEWQSQRGGLNPKYEGEGVSNTYIEYDPNLRTSDLDPNYLYGENARQQNRQEAGYIARRNDQIASALYNEGITDKEGVANYLNQQNGWMDSTNEDRLNTIDSIWKRIGQISPTSENNEIDYSRLDSIRGEDTSGKLYGKTTADEGNPEAGIDTLSDANSIYRMMEERRMSEVKDLLSMGTDNIAAALYGGELAEGSQSMRDYQTTYPELWNEVQTKLKQYKGQGTIDAITNGGEIPTNTNGTSGINNNIADFASENAGYSESMQDILKDVHQTISSNSSASAANDAMADMEEEMVALTKRLKNLDKEAQSVFKGDVPDYIVKAYINNRTQEIQDKLSTLSERYKYASARYDKEVENAKWEKEYKLKERQVKIQEESFALEDWKARNGITNTNPNDKGNTNPGDKYQVTTMSDAEVASAVDELLTMYDNGQIGNAQCGVGIQKYYLPMLGISLNNISSFDNKKALINEGEDYIPKKGDLIILSSKSSPENGHIGIVLGVHSDGTIEYMDWNGSLGADGKGTEKVAINGININDSKIQGFRNINKNQTSNAYGWTDTDYANFEKLLDANTDKTDVEAIALKYGYKNNVPALTQIAREAIAQRGNTETPIIYENSTWIDYMGLTEEQLAEVEKQVGYNPNAEWYFKSIIDEGKIPTTGPAMQNAIKITGAKDERQFGQWLEHYQNKVNAEAATAGEDILLLLAQLQNLYREADREDKVTKDGKTKTVFDTNAWQGWGNGTIGIKYEQLIKQLLLNKVTEARAKGATFGQMTEYEWRILEDAASALKIKFGPKSSDEGFSEAFFDLVNATWKLTHDSKSGPTATQWENYLNQIKNESEWYMTSGGQDLGIIDGSNLGGSQGTYNIENNDSTMGVLFGTGS